MHQYNRKMHCIFVVDVVYISRTSVVSFTTHAG